MLEPGPSPRVAVVGAGHLGRFHCEKLHELQAMGYGTLAAVVDTDADHRAAAAQRFGVPAVSTIVDLERIAPPIDAAIIATPTPSHEALGCEALAHGWHVLIEKPLAGSSAAAKRLTDHAAAAGRILQVGHSERFNPAVAAALRIADRPRYIVAERLGPFSGRATDDDVIFDLMIHDLDIAATLIDSALVEVRAIGVPVLTHEVDMAAARLAFANGAVAQLSAGRASLAPSRKIRLFTVERYLSVDCLLGEVKSVRRSPATPGGSDGFAQIVGEPVEIAAADALLTQDRDFLRCARTGEAPRVTGAAGLRAVRLCEAVKAELERSRGQGVKDDS